MDARDPNDPEPLASRSRSTWWLAAALLFLATCALYAPSARFNFIYDDGQLILNQPPPESLGDVAAVFLEPHWPGLPYYRPVTRATMVAQKWIHGDVPAPFHLFNVTLMGLTAVLAFALLSLPALRVRLPFALLGAALLAAHPLASTTVYPICSGRETLIPATLSLAALYAFLRPGRGFTALSILLTGLALLGKETGVMVPVTFVLADALGLTSDPPGRDPLRWLRRYSPFALLGVAYLAIRWWLFADSGLHHVALLERPFYPLLTVAYTLQTSFAPFVEMVYEPQLAAWWSVGRTLVWVAAAALLVLGCVRGGPALRAPVLFWLGWWILVQLPTANLLRQESPFAERYGFLALMGLVGIAGAVVSAHSERRGARWLAIAGGVVLLIILGTISAHRGRYFANDKVFSLQWVATDPGSYKAQLRLGHGYQAVGQWEPAIEHLSRASDLRPGDATVENSLGYVLWRHGDTERAVVHLERAVALAPRFALAHTNLADVHARRGDLEPAARHFRLALQIEPDNARAQHHLARVLIRQDRLDEAVVHFERALALEPLSAATLVELGEVEEQLGRPDAARTHYQAALRLRPEQRRARRNLERLGAGP